MGVHDIQLDRDVRDWVLVPLTASIFLMMLIRQYVTQVLGVPREALIIAAYIAECFVSTEETVLFELLAPLCWAGLHGQPLSGQGGDEGAQGEAGPGALADAARHVWVSHRGSIQAAQGVPRS